ncbi:M1 family metallopeptidase [Burkholderiaceae bacterium DAT-1]|nr:M1 family metallopeptidase [Burkholderiaceae bacterium DAT-1]
MRIAQPLLHLSALAVATVFSGVQAEVVSPRPFSFADTPGRLPKDIVPLDYTVSIKPDVTQKLIEGQETIQLKVLKPTRTIQFNSLNQTLSDVLIDGQPVQRVESNNEQQLTTLTLNAPLKPGKHVLRFNYRGKIESGPFGLYAQSFVKPDGQKDVLLSTQFQATDARRMFPCWDEPVFRATFKLTTTLPGDWAAISNMPVLNRKVQGDLATIEFARSPKMSSYLLELSAGNFARIQTKAENVDIGIWAIKGQEQQGETALANAKTILADYNHFFGLPYPLPKLDSIAIPGGISGAMENWGAITYNDQSLLVQDGSTLNAQQRVFSIQAHEIAHQWFGNLVTMNWWDGLWLNESFASWLAAKETDSRHPEWHWWETADADKESAMTADAQLTSHPIQQHVTNELEAASAFDMDITYSKGQSVLRMVEGWLGEDAFRQGIQQYMKARQYSNATSADLWQALGKASKRDVASVAASWTEQAGFPLVSVSARCDAQGKRTITLNQSRFLLSGEETNKTTWQVPLQIRSGIGQTPTTVLLNKANQTLSAGQCADPLSINANVTGYYRVQYDDETLARNTAAFRHLSSGDQIALFDDQWALAATGRRPLSDYLALVGAMGDTPNLRAWQQIASSLDTIEQSQRGKVNHAAFMAHARQLLQPISDRLGWSAGKNEPLSLQKLRRRLLSLRGQWGDEAVVSEARSRFEHFLSDAKAFSTDERSVFVNIVASHADAETFTRLHELAKQARTDAERRHYYIAMAQVRDPALAARVGDIMLSDDIPVHLESLRLQLLTVLSAQHPMLGWTLFSAHSKRLLKSQEQYASLYLAQYCVPMFYQAMPLETLEQWVRDQIPATLHSNLARSMESARFKLKQQQTLVSGVDTMLSSTHSASAI